MPPINKVRRKKLQQSATYIKGTEISSKEELKNVIDSAEVIYLKQQVIYDDESQSMTVEIHFKHVP